MNYKSNTRELYNDQAEDWSRKEPVLLSDYSARPFVLDLCEPIKGLKKEGVKGFLKGTMKGITGLFAKPVSGLLDGV